MNPADQTGPAPDRGGAPAPPHPCVKVPLALAGHVAYLLSLVFVVATSLVILLPLLPFPAVRRRVSGTLLRAHLRFFALRFLPAVKACQVMECSGQEHLRGPGPAIFVANHRSSIDAILLMALLPPTSLVIKARHARKPGYGALVHFFDFISVAAGAPSAIQHSLDKGRKLLRSGVSLLVFPEGIRASSSRLMPFSDFAFRLACTENVPCIPLVIHSDRPFLNRQPGSYFPPDVVRFRIRILPPVAIPPDKDPRLLSDTVSRQMAPVLARLDALYLEHP